MPNIYLDVLFGFVELTIIFILPIFVVYRSKRRLLVGIWFFLGYAWTFISFARGWYVEEDFIDTSLWIAITYPMYSAQRWVGVFGVFVFWLPHDLELSIGTALLFPLAIAFALLYLSLPYVAYKIIRAAYYYWKERLQSG